VGAYKPIDAERAGFSRLGLVQGARRLQKRLLRLEKSGGRPPGEGSKTLPPSQRRSVRSSREERAARPTALRGFMPS
jgi:hypothetical protein